MIIAPPTLNPLLKPNKGWHSRGYLPHFDSDNEVQSLNFRLLDAVPMHVIEGWRRELGWRKGLNQRDPRAVALRQRIEKYEDAGLLAHFSFGPGRCYRRNCFVKLRT